MDEQPHGGVDGEENKNHKKEGDGRRRLEKADQKKILNSLKEQHPVSRTFATAKWRPVDIQDILAIRSE